MRLAVLAVHGFGGTPATLGPVVDALVEGGFTVAAPTLPGHGTVIDDLVPTRWSDWSATVEDAYQELAAVHRVAVVGTSMGGALGVWLAGRHPEIAGMALVNPMVTPPEPDLRAFVKEMLDAGEEISPGMGSDIADPDAEEDAYVGSPLAPLLSLYDALDELQGVLPSIRCPILLFTSVQDHVVDPAHSDHVAATVAGPVERVALERSFHVATLDYDKDLIASRTVDFVRSLSDLPA